MVLDGVFSLSLSLSPCVRRERLCEFSVRGTRLRRRRLSLSLSLGVVLFTVGKPVNLSLVDLFSYGGVLDYSDYGDSLSLSLSLSRFLW